jgi:Ni/Co efflux regulator RcnB
MRKLLLMSLVAALAMPSVADARRRGEVRRDRHEVRQDRQELRQDRRNGASRGELREDRRELREDRRELREDRRDLRQDRRRAAYVGPYRGWVYRPLSRGYVLRPIFWGPAYLVDYSLYRLARPRADQRWIRYGDDLVLVNIRTGRVIEVIPNRY